MTTAKITDGTLVITSTGKAGTVVGEPYVAVSGKLYAHVAIPGRRGTTSNLVANLTVRGADLKPGDPIPPERTGGLGGYVAGECGHRLAASEWRAGFRNCERCGAESVFRLTDAASRSLGCE